ncbi:MAG: hypothetical protein ACRD0U_03315, partial [Acidimicrobiales bacterium]
AATGARDLVDDASAAGLRRLAMAAGAVVVLFGIVVVVRRLARWRRTRPASAVGVAAGNLFAPTYPLVPPTSDDVSLDRWGPPASTRSPPGDDLRA